MTDHRTQLHLASFASKVRFESLDLAGAFADWLEEHGDPRGVLLRRRWKMWLRERGKVQAEVDEVREKFGAMWKKLKTWVASNPQMRLTTEGWVKHTGMSEADDSFRRYVIGKFPESSPPLHDDA